MNELTPKLPQNIEETLANYYSAPTPSAEFTSRLELRLQRKMQQNQNKNICSERKTFVKTLHTHPVLIMLIVMLILFALSGVVYAIGRSLGYIPGVGIVEQGSSLRILEESFTVEDENISLTIEQVVAGPDKTLVVFHYVVPPFDPSTYESPMDPNTGNPALILPDGSRLEINIGKRIPGTEIPTDDGTPIRYLWEFPPLANDITEVTLKLPNNLPLIPPGADPKNWQIPFKLIPAPEGFVIPVFEVEANEAGSGSRIETVSSLESSSMGESALHGIKTSVDMFVPLDDGYLLIGSMQWSEKDYSVGAVKPTGDIHLIDETGAEVPFEPILGPDPELPQDGDYRSYWAIKVLSKNLATPLKITINSVFVDTYDNSIRFQFDPGANPVPGKSWDINQDFQIGDIQARILTATLTTYGDPNLVFDYAIQAKPNELLDVYIGININQCMGGGGSYPSEPSEVIQVSAYTCRADLPPGPLETSVSGAVIWGPWQVEWTPPATTTAPLSLTAPPPVHAEACLNKDSWQQALKNRPPLPADLTGKLALAESTGEIVIADLSGGTQEVVGKGDAPSFSPDGSRVAVVGPAINSQPADGLYIIDLASGTSTYLPGTTPTDGNPIWSPDGTKIAFTRRLAGSTDESDQTAIMVVNPDGSDLRQLTPFDGVRIVTAWMPDSIQIVYIARYGLINASASLLNIETGDVSEMFGINYGYGLVDISPDGKQAVYENWLPGDVYALFISSLDGANLSLLAQGPETTVVIPKWSPDSHWVIATVYEGNSDGMLVLIQVDTCQIIPLRNLSGYVGSWIP